MAHMGGTASAEIDAPLDTVWAVVEDVLTAPDWQGGLEAITALEHDDEGRPTLVESVSDIKVRHVKTQVRFSYEPPTRLSWSQEKGDLKSVEGSWLAGGSRRRANPGDLHARRRPRADARHADPRADRGRRSGGAGQRPPGRAEGAGRGRVEGSERPSRVPDHRQAARRGRSAPRRAGRHPRAPLWTFDG